LREHGVTQREIEDAWRARIAELRADPRMREIRSVPRAHPQIVIERGEGDLRTIVWSVAFDPAPEPGSTCTLVHVGLGPFDRALWLHDFLREERRCEALGAERLVGHYGPGERVMLAIEVHSPLLGATVRVHAERTEIR